MDDLYQARDFEQFWQTYARAHASPDVRRQHWVATTTAAVMLAGAVARRDPRLALLAVATDYAIAQASHRRHGQRTQPLRRPHWHLRAELRLWRRTTRSWISQRTSRA